MGFRGNVARGISGNIFSDKGMLFGTFLMKNIFINFPTPILNHHFCTISSKFSMIFIGISYTFMMYSHTTIKFATKKHEIFNRMYWKIYFNIGVGKSTKIFFIRNVANNILLSLKMFPVMPLAPLPRKSMIFSCVFMFSDYCRVSYSKCMHCGSALQKRALLVRARSQK